MTEIKKRAKKRSSVPRVVSNLIEREREREREKVKREQRIIKEEKRM